METADYPAEISVAFHCALPEVPLTLSLPEVPHPLPLPEVPPHARPV